MVPNTFFYPCLLNELLQYQKQVFNFLCSIIFSSFQITEDAVRGKGPVVYHHGSKGGDDEANNKPSSEAPPSEEVKSALAGE